VKCQKGGPPAHYYQKYEAFTAGQIDWTVPWKYYGREQTPLTAATELVCKNTIGSF